jgi:hypothetical protein
MKRLPILILISLLGIAGGCKEEPQVTGADEAPKGSMSSERGASTTGGPQTAPQPDIK